MRESVKIMRIPYAHLIIINGSTATRHQISSFHHTSDSSKFWKFPEKCWHSEEFMFNESAKNKPNLLMQCQRNHKFNKCRAGKEIIVPATIFVVCHRNETKLPKIAYNSCNSKFIQNCICLQWVVVVSRQP